MSSQSSLQYYKSLGYGIINRTLRENTIPPKIPADLLQDTTIRHIKTIDESMKNDGSLKSIKLYRGIRGEDLLSQGTLVNRAYSSCSLDPEQTRAFKESECCLLIFEVPEEVKFYIYSSSSNDWEKEVLLQRDTEFVNIKSIGLGIYTCYLKLYRPPIITHADIARRLAMEKQLSIARANMLLDSDED